MRYDYSPIDLLLGGICLQVGEDCHIQFYSEPKE